MQRSIFLGAAGGLCAAQWLRPLNGLASDDRARVDLSEGVPIVEVDVGGTRPARMVFDTGNSALGLDIDRARALGIDLPASAKETRGTPPNAFTLYRLRLPQVQVGGVRLNDVAAVAVDLSAAIRRSYGFDVDGSLGYGALKNYVVQLDYARSTLLVANAVPPDNRADSAIRVPITWLKYQPQSPLLVTFDGLSVDGINLVAQLDTFLAANAIVFSTKTPRFSALPAAANAKPITYEEATLRPARCSDIALGSLRLGGTEPVVYVADEHAHVPTTDISAVVGNGLLAGRLLTLDFPKSTITVSAT
jgi:hypothetical protein